MVEESENQKAAKMEGLKEMEDLSKRDDLGDGTGEASKEEQIVGDEL